jgi:hypothetical protein
MILGDKKDEKTYRRSVFSGIYNVQQVDVTLSGGKFTQKLTGIRVEEEEAKLVDKAPAAKESNDKKKTADDPAKKAPPIVGGNTDLAVGRTDATATLAGVAGVGGNSIPDARPRGGT